MSKRYPLLDDKEWLEEKYLEEKLSSVKIAKIIGCVKSTVLKALHKFDIQMRPISGEGRVHIELSDKEWLRAKYEDEELCCEAISSLIGCSGGTVRNALKRFGIHIRKKTEMYMGAKNPHFGKCHTEEAKRKNREAHIGKRASEEAKEKLREARKRRIFPNHHTKPELIFIDFCQLFGIAERVEDTSNNSFHIGRLNPDFIIRDMRIAIFINGDYWHSQLLRPTLRDTQQPKFQIAECKKHKWKAVIIWESDLLREDAEAFVRNALKNEGVIKCYENELGSFSREVNIVPLLHDDILVFTSP